MPKYFFIFILLFQFIQPVAQAKHCGRLTEKTLKQVCDRNPTWEETFRCMSAGKDRYLDGCALAACDRCASGPGTTACVESIRDQMYTLAEVLACDSMSTDNLTAQCFYSSGTSYIRYQRLELARKSGRSDGRQAAQNFKAELSQGLHAGEAKGRELAIDKAKSDSRQNSFNEGYRQARSESNLRNASAYSAGQLLGAALAKERAEKIDGPSAFRATFDARIGATPAAQQTVDLVADTTAPTPKGSNLDLHFQLPEQGTNPVPDFAMPSDAAREAPQYTVAIEKTIQNESIVFPIASVNPIDSPCLDSDLPCRQAYSEGHREGFQSEFRQRYLAEFAKGFTTAAQTEYLKAVSNPDLVAREQGTQSGSREQGILDAFASHYPVEKQQAEVQAERGFSEALRKGFMGVVRNIRIQSQGRAILIPGQRFHMDVEIDNLGGVDVPAGYFQVSTGTFELGILEKNSRVLPAIPANTRVTFKSVFTGIAHRAPAGTDFKMELVLSTRSEDNQIRTRQTLPATVTTRFPLELVRIEPQAAFNGTAAVAATFTLKNELDIASDPFTAVLNTEPSAVAVQTNGAIRIPVLQPGETWDTQVVLQPGIWTNEGIPTVFTVTLSDSQQRTMSTQRFGHFIDLRRAVALQALSAGKNISNSVVEGRAGTNVPVSIAVSCRQSVGYSEGYRFRYVGSNQSAINFTGTVGADLGKCDAGRTRVLSPGSVRIDRSALGQLGTLQFHLEKNGAVVQGLQVFIQAK